MWVYQNNLKTYYIYIAERESKDKKKELKKVSLYENNLGLRIEPASKYFFWTTWKNV